MTPWLRMALGLAAQGRGRVEPNPMVGCVLEKDGVVVGRGYHRRYGGRHGEIVALDAAGPRARGATVHVTLEPCGHHGKTPPCAEALVAAGVARVVYASRDPNLDARGGLRLLEEAGVTVEAGGVEAEARILNRRVEGWRMRATPWTVAKWGASLDGRIADAEGGSTYITSEASRRVVHEIRGSVDAIVVGVGTVLADDPLLTCRRPGGRSPRRVILDGRLRTPADGRLAATAGEVRTTIIARPGADATARAALEAVGIEVVEEASLTAAFERLRREGEHRVLLEGGPSVLASALEEGLVDQVLAFLAPVILGGRAAPGPVGGDGVSTVAAPRRLTDVRVTRHGDDVLVEGYLDPV